MKFYVLLLILLFGVANLKIVDCYKCDFYFDLWEYTCKIKPDPVIVEEKHVDKKTDDNVKVLEFKGNNSTHLNQSEFGPVCQRFKNLKEIYVFSVKSVDENLFQQCMNLNYIWIENSEIEEFPENLFSSQSSLTQIHLVRNKLKTLPENIFSNQKKLEGLYLGGNQISCLPTNIFKSLEKLKELSLGGNKIESLNPKWFESLQSLTVLRLNDNKIQDLPKNVFAHLRNLEELYLYDNQLTTIHSDSFGIHRNLEEVKLKNNKINSIDEKFIDNTAAWELDMSGNVCSKEDIYGSKNKIKAKLSNCISNYQPRAVPTEIKCGTRVRVKGTIINGTVTETNEYPWNVALIHTRMGLICGGTLVSSKHIVTAAHCIREKKSSNGFNTNELSVLLGVHNHTHPYEEGRISAHIQSIKIHDDWSATDSRYDADIAVLELENEVEFSRIIRPICLANESSEIARALKGTVVGFGMTEKNKLSDVARKLEIPIRDYHDCIERSSDLQDFASARTFCGGPADGRGVCDGDSGSGVYVLYNDQFYLRGLVSSSLVNEYGECKVEKEALFTNIPRYYDWINRMKLLNGKNGVGRFLRAISTKGIRPKYEE